MATPAEEIIGRLRSGLEPRLAQQIVAAVRRHYGRCRVCGRAGPAALGIAELRGPRASLILPPTGFVRQ